MTVQAAAVTANGARTATAGLAGGKPTIQVRDVATGAVVCNLVGHEAAVTSVAFSPDGTKLASASLDKTARVWNLADPQFAQLVKFELHMMPVTAVAFSADGTHVFSGGADNTIRQWAVAGGAEVRAIPGHTGAISDLAVDGAVVVS